MMKVLSNLMGNESKIKYTEVAVQRDGTNLNIKEYVDGVVESGSNTNGYYVKYVDGTMIQYGLVSVTTSTNAYNTGFTHYGIETSVNLPLSFNDNNFVVTANCNGPIAYVTILNVNKDTSYNDRFNIRMISSQSNYTRDILWQAIGKWK